MSIKYSENDPKKKYKIDITNKDKSISILKSFLNKYEFKKQTMMCELKVGASEDDGQLYLRNVELFNSCSIFYKFEGNKLIIEVYKGSTSFDMPADEKYIKLVDNAVIDIKKANGYKEKDLPDKHDVSEFDEHEKKRKFIKKYDEVTFWPFAISMFGTPILFIVMLLTKFENMTVNVLFAVCLIFFVGNIIFTKTYKNNNKL